VNAFAAVGDFLAGKSDDVPFGFAWLKGITPGRFGLVALVCFVFALRQSPYGLRYALQQQFVETIVFANLNLVSALPMLVLVTSADRHTRRASRKRRICALSLAVLAGAIIYSAAITLAFGIPSWGAPSHGPLLLLPPISFFLRVLLMGGLLTGVLYFVTREVDTAEALQSARLNRMALDRQMAEAQLHVLQAQIEPHFLFNTLAHVKRLYRIDRSQAKAMLHNLTDYLQEALPQMREENSTLGRELALARAYLNVLQARMGERLEVLIAVPQELLAAELPPMMLSTLVENAVKHGIAPKAQGGVVKIDAARDGDRIKVSVSDDGVGFVGSTGSGVGLANTRARLTALYGADGLLTFAANPVRGVTVSVTLPHRVVNRDIGNR
jgi:signal transduction histidine kinase